MRDVDFDMFVDAFGEATSSRPVPPEAIEKWRGRLPDKLLEYWKNEGWARYRHGLFRLVDPDDYADEVTMWLEDTPLDGVDTFHAFAVSAFGELFLCGEQCGPRLGLLTPMASFVALRDALEPKPEDEKNLEIQVFFSAMEPKDVDLEDESGKRLFERARKALGDLAEDELYAFEPALPVGGEVRLQNLSRRDARVHMAMLRELTEPHMPMDLAF